MAVCCANAKYGNGTSAELTSRNLFGSPVSGPHSRVHTVHYTFKILSLHTCARRVTACRRNRKKEREEKVEKSHAATTCLLRDAVVSALVICPFVIDVPTEGAIIFAYMHTKIFALSTTPNPCRRLYVVSYDYKCVGKFYWFFFPNMYTYVNRLKNL